MAMLIRRPPGCSLSAYSLSPPPPADRDPTLSLSSNPRSPKNIPFAVPAVGKTWDDPYRWMSKTDNPDLIDFLHRENSYAEAFMDDTKHLQERLAAEMKARMPPRVTTPPES